MLTKVLKVLVYPNGVYTTRYRTNYANGVLPSEYSEITIHYGRTFRLSVDTEIANKVPGEKAYNLGRYDVTGINVKFSTRFT